MALDTPETKTPPSSRPLSVYFSRELRSKIHGAAILKNKGDSALVVDIVEAYFSGVTTLAEDNPLKVLADLSRRVEALERSGRE